MKVLSSIFCAIGLLCSGSLWAEYAPSEIEIMADRDQSLRKDWIYTKDVVAKEGLLKEVRLHEIACTKRLQGLIEESGLATCEDIPEVAQLVLRSSDLNFQKEALAIILNLEDESWKKWIPLLTDRILLRQNLPQRYGTHLHLNDGSCLPYPIENEEGVDFLRKEFGMLPLQRYIERTRKEIAAIERGDRQYLQKCFFNEYHDIDNDPEDYLYYVVLEKRQHEYILGLPNPELYLKPAASPEITVAFEHPAYAAMYALHKLGLKYEIGGMSQFENEDEEGDETAANPVICYKPTKEGIDGGIILPIQFDIPFWAEKQSPDDPCSVFLVPRKAFQPREYEDFFCKRIFVSQQNVEPAYRVKYSFILEPLAWLEHEVQIKEENGDGSFLKRSFSIRSFYCSLLFNINLENENFFEK